MPFYISSDCGYADGTKLEAPDGVRKKAAAGTLSYHGEVCRANVDIEVAYDNAAKAARNPSSPTGSAAMGAAPVADHDQQFASHMERKVHLLPVKTLRTIMHELGHAHVSLFYLQRVHSS